MKIYCFGNEFLENDSLAKTISDEIVLPGVDFIKCNSPEEIFFQEEKIIILDVVEKINDVVLIQDLDTLKDNKIKSLHDFDLSFFLKLMKEMKKIKDMIIIGIPIQGNKETIKEQVISEIKKLHK
jgi:Ni,Fe-hydrogenase maturation factor